ncbi:MAG: AraC family transcriptional regulator [Puia sp.]|nr:AraC family transcriptional regulator [Puia sp.]
MSYVSLENSEPFLKCFESIARSRACTISDSVLYLSGKSGKGFITVAGVLPGVEVMVVNVSMLADDLSFSFLPSSNTSSYILSFDEIGLSAETGNDWILSDPGWMRGQADSSVSITDADHGKYVVYPKGKVVRSLLIRVQKSSMGQLMHDWDVLKIRSVVDPPGNEIPRLCWPMTFKYRLLIGDFMEGIIDHPFRELFALRNVSLLLEYLLQQFLVMDKLVAEGLSFNEQDVNGLSRVEEHLCRNYKKEFPGIEKLSRISAMSPTSLKTKFKKYYGDTLFGYFQKNKLEKAKKLLDGKVPVKVVATEIGYSNPSHFTLAFKKEYGFSPWHYLNPQ